MKKIFYIFPFFALIVSFIVYVVLKETNNPSFEKKSTNLSFSIIHLFQMDPSTDAITDISGRVLRLNDLENKVVLINFWASWCSPCVKEIPSLNELAKIYKNELVVIAISADSSFEDLKSFLKSFKDFGKENTYVIYINNNQELMEKFGIFKLPESIIFDKKLIFKKKVSGSIEWNSRESLQYFDEMIKSK